MTIQNLTKQLDPIFHPRSVAIIGASNREGSFGRLFLEGFKRVGFPRTYPVHPRDKELLGLTAYPGIGDIPHGVDLAILLIPNEGALKVVKECADKGVKGIVLFTAGFRETGEAGKKIEQELAKIARGSGSRIIGPNTNGLYCPASRLLTLPGALTAGGLPSESGPLSVFSQSGSFNDYLTQVLTGKNLRFNKVVSCGNECDLGAEDFLEYFGADSETRLIAGYLEGIKNGRRFYNLASDVSRRKPIIIWKGGQTEYGARAALAHTGSLAGSREVWEAMFRQSGIIGVSSFEEIVDCLLAFYWLPQPRGKKVAILSGMGGTNVGTSDNCLAMGLEIARFGEETSKRLVKLLPAVGTATANPVDIGVGSLMAPQLYGESIKIIAGDENVDMLLVITAPDSPPSIKSIVDAVKEINKPLAVALFDIPGLVGPQFKSLLENHIPTYYEPKRAALALSRLARYAEFVAGSKLS